MTQWWNRNAERQFDVFNGWIGDFNHKTKIYCRSHVAKMGYSSILDCGCGPATEYYGYKNDSYEIDYTGLDSCQYFLDLNRNKGINMIESDLDKKIEIPNNSFDCVYCREVLEHLQHYENAIESFINIAKKEVLIVWFIKPSKDEDMIDYWESEDLYHNKYNIDRLEEFILNFNKVDKIDWHDFSDKESALHIKLK